MLYNEATGNIISTLPVNPRTGTLSVADGKEAAVRPGVNEYIMTAPSDFVSPGRASRAATQYKVGVQTVSLYTEQASEIAWTQSDVTGVDCAVDDDDSVRVIVDGDNITVKSSLDCEVRIVDLLGRTVAAGVANAPLCVPSKGIFIVTTPAAAVKIKK